MASGGHFLHTSLYCEGIVYKITGIRLVIERLLERVNVISSEVLNTGSDK